MEKQKIRRKIIELYYLIQKKKKKNDKKNETEEFYFNIYFRTGSGTVDQPTYTLVRGVICFVAARRGDSLALYFWIFGVRFAHQNVSLQQCCVGPSFFLDNN